MTDYKINNHLAFRFISIINIILLLHLVGCAKTEVADNRSEGVKATNNSASLAFVDNTIYKYYPLTLTKFNNIRNNVDEFSSITVKYYSTIINPDDSADHSALILMAGQYDLTKSYEDITNIYSTLSQDLYSQNPVKFRALERNFSVSDIEPLLTYLTDHSSYFFNGEEYGSNEYYMGQVPNMFNSNFTFLLIIRPPGKSTENPTPEWVINKAFDTYPPVDHPLYGLFQLLENDFIDEFQDTDEGMVWYD